MKTAETLLTLDMLFELPKKILSMDTSSNYVTLLEESTFNRYYTPELRIKLLNLFREFNDTKYLFSMSIHGINCTTNYEINENKKLFVNKDKVGNYVAKKLDTEAFITDIYYRIINLSNKLTYHEAVYFVNTFFSHLGEEYISEKIGISRTYLQKIKKSCITKMYFVFSDFLVNI